MTEKEFSNKAILGQSPNIAPWIYLTVKWIATSSLLLRLRFGVFVSNENMPRFLSKKARLKHSIS